jgi:hypothetical protein
MASTPPVDGVRVGSGRPEDRAAARQDLVDVAEPEGLGEVLDRPLPATPEADELVPVGVDPLDHDRADHRVQPGAVPAACQYTDSHATTLVAPTRVTHVTFSIVARDGDAVRRCGRQQVPRRRRRGAGSGGRVGALATQAYANLAYRADGLGAAASRPLGV